MMDCKVLIIILLIGTVLSIRGAPAGINAPELFDKDPRMDKLLVKNHIAYHFRKVVREVNQELFVSRQIDISSLFLGIQVLEHTRDSLSRYCRSLNHTFHNPSTPSIPLGKTENLDNKSKESNYTLVRVPYQATFTEAKARCEALGMQLPELYTQEQVTELTAFLKKVDVKMCFAGLQGDPLDATTRFIATGFPIWRSAISELSMLSNGQIITMMHIMDDMFAKYMYTSSGQLLVSLDRPSTVERKKYASHTYRHESLEFPQTIGRIVCEKKWDGKTYTSFLTESSNIKDLKVINTYITSRHKRAVMQENASGLSNTDNEVKQAVMQESVSTFTKPKRAVKPNIALNTEDTEFDSLQELCLNVRDLAEETHKAASSKLTDLLSSVDVSIHLEKDFSRQKRVPKFLAKIVFSTGVKLIWNIFTFLQRTRKDNRIKSLQTAVAATGDLANYNNNVIKEMSEILYGQSISIQKLTIKTENLDQRLFTVEHKVVELESKTDKIENKLEIVLTLQSIENLVIRIKNSHDDGYATLENIIHCSLLGQTSPQILPVRQMEIVQGEVRKVSTAILDPDFSRMQSIIVSDPRDPHLLLIVVNMAALGRRNLELVNLIPIPSFEHDKAYVPVLDYSTIVLDQLSATYSVLTPLEESRCLTDRCYVSNVERPTAEKGCGIPQLYNRHLDACVYDDVTSTGIFVQPMLPDGIIFSLKNEVDVQLFCKDNTDIRSPKRLRGSGVLQLPNGCTLSVTDDLGRTTRIKGQPVFRMIDAEDLELSANGPLGSTKTINGRNRTHRLAAYDNMLSEHYSSVIRQVETVDTKLSGHSHFMWGLTGSIILVFLLTIFAFLVSYKYSRRFRKKIHKVRSGIHEITQQITHLQASLPFSSAGIRRQVAPPAIPPKPVGALMQELLDKRNPEGRSVTRRLRSKSSNQLNSHGYGFDHIYQPPSSFSQVKRPVSQGIYPSVPDEPEEWTRSMESLKTIDESCAPVHKSNLSCKKHAEEK
jgi:hypothetical protein